MKSYNIDTSYTEYANLSTECKTLSTEDFHNLVLFRMIKNIIKNEFKEANTPYIKNIVIAHLMAHITNDTLLNSTIGVLKGLGLLKHEEKIRDYLHPIISKLIYSKEDITRIRAFVFSALHEYETLMLYNKSFVEENVPILIFDVKGRNVYHNLESINNSLRPKKIDCFIKNYIEVLPMQEQKNEYGRLIKEIAKIDYEYGTDSRSEINYLSILKENIVDELPLGKVVFDTNLHNHIFSNNGFTLFKFILENHIKEKRARF